MSEAVPRGSPSDRVVMVSVSVIEPVGRLTVWPGSVGSGVVGRLPKELLVGLRELPGVMVGFFPGVVGTGVVPLEVGTGTVPLEETPTQTSVPAIRLSQYCSDLTSGFQS